MKKNNEVIAELIKSISGQKNTITIPRVYVDFFDGDIYTALFVNQCIFWSDRTTRADGYFYKKQTEWQEETGLRRHRLEKAVEKCGEFLDTKVLLANGAPTKHYHFRFADFCNSICEFLQNSSAENGKTLTDDFQLNQEEEEGNPPPPIEPLPLNPDYAKMNTAFMNMRGGMNGLQAEALVDLYKEWNEYRDGLAEFHPDKEKDTADVIVQAIKVTAQSADNPNVKYVKAVLEGWRRNGVGGKPRVYNKNGKTNGRPSAQAKTQEELDAAREKARAILRGPKITETNPELFND